MPEPYLGSLEQPRGVFLALNPGRADLSFQGRDGKFAREISENYGTYAAWAASLPYLRDPWIAKNGRNRHHEARLRFPRDWCDDRSLSETAMASFELYPWHSAHFTGSLGNEAHRFIERYVWRPVAELAAPVFAFAARWFPILENMPGLKVVKRLGVDGEPYGSKSRTRSVMVLRGKGITVIAEKHRGSAAPPNREETKLLRNVLAEVE